MPKEGIQWHIKAKVEKREYKDGPIVETIESDGNLVTDAGADRLANLLIGAGSDEALDSSHVRIGVGNDDSAAAGGDTALSTGSSEFYEVMAASYPQQTSGVVSFRSEFGDTDANFVWACWGLDVDNSGSVSADGTPVDLFNRKVFAFGEKDGGTWTLTVTLSLS